MIALVALTVFAGVLGLALLPVRRRALQQERDRAQVGRIVHRHDQEGAHR